MPPICLQIPSKVKLTLGKSILLLWNISFSPCKIVPVGHPTGAISYSSRPVKYPTGVTDSARTYFSWPSLHQWKTCFSCSFCLIIPKSGVLSPPHDQNPSYGVGWNLKPGFLESLFQSK
jgi:hypothetical protein